MPCFRVIRKTITFSQILVEADNADEAREMLPPRDDQWYEVDEYGHDDQYEVTAEV